MPEDPVRHQYQPSDRAEVFEFLRASLPADVCARLIGQWAWKFENNPVDPQTIDIIRIGRRLVATAIGFRVRMWAGGVECFGEARGMFLTHPEHRGQRIWKRVGALHPKDAPILFGWSMLPVGTVMDEGWIISPVTPLLRIIDARGLIEHVTHSKTLGLIGAAAGVVARATSAPFSSKSRHRGDNIVCLDSFDERADALWKRARRPTKLMVVRDRRYLNWRYCERPDASYLLYGFQRGSELAGFLVVRVSLNRGMRWAYLVDFLVEEHSRDVLSALVNAALDDMRRDGVVAVTCHATDAASRRILFRRGFFPLRRRPAVNVNRRVLPERIGLRHFESLRDWYLTMGDGDFEMVF